MIGILGSGQLGRMTAMAAHALGIETLVFDQKMTHMPGGQVSPFIEGKWDDWDALRDFAQSVDVITYEFENIPLAAVRYLNDLTPVFPPMNALEIASDRIAEKAFFSSLEIEIAPYRPLRSLDQLSAIIDELSISASGGVPVIVKTARLGYDGHGQRRISSAGDIPEAMRYFNDHYDSSMSYVVECCIDLAAEYSLIVGRAQDGAICIYEPSLNQHQDQILKHSTVPAQGLNSQQSKIMEIYARKIVEGLNYVGIIGIEFFKDQAGHILVNEIAPRPHNSGHWTMDGTHCSQFQQLARILSNLPLGSSKRIADSVKMVNLIGDDVQNLNDYLQDDHAILHLYGKQEARKGRKMGHVNLVNAP